MALPIYCVLLRLHGDDETAVHAFHDCAEAEAFHESINSEDYEWVEWVETNLE